jgi:hypothetical protein
MLKAQEDSKKWKLKLPKNSRRVCNTVSNAEARAKNDIYHSNKGLLYKVSSMGEDLLCVPDDSISRGRMTLQKKIIAETHDGITSIHLGEVELIMRYIDAYTDQVLQNMYTITYVHVRHARKIRSTDNHHKDC